MASRKLKIEPPTKDTPGYLKRVRTVTTLIQRINGNEVSPELIDNFIDFVLPYVIEPEDRNEARELLLELSENEYMAILNAVTNTEDNVPKVKEEPSETSSTQA